MTSVEVYELTQKTSKTKSVSMLQDKAVYAISHSLKL